eukprot:GHRR01013207.1.p1 GENE.GHRR01013207.1~~GHRR01013207.1.p1  ORF type:complete len:536 (+),score=192.87 GHRR01013207.1:1802-3409(+)
MHSQKAVLLARQAGSPQAVFGLARFLAAVPTGSQQTAGISTSSTAHAAEAAPAAAAAAAVGPAELPAGFPADLAAATEGPAALYTERVRSGLYRPDALQQVTVSRLQTVYQDLREAYPPPQRRSGLTLVDHVETKQTRSSWFDGISMLLRSQSGLQGSAGPHGQRFHVRGLYMYGGVGCGKTMLMDMLVEAAPREFQVERVHFHDFMLDIHSRLRHVKEEADPLKHVADSVAETIKVLALDELFVTDVADAMILHRLFGRLWDKGLTLVGTSNRAPDALYEGGLQRQLFLPFIHRLKESCYIHNMQSPVDYRRLAHHARGTYFLTPDRTALLHEAFLQAGQASLKHNSSIQGASAGAVGHPSPVTIEVAMGRLLHVSQALGSAAMFSFAELCDRPLAAADYIALAERFHTVAVADVPRFDAANRVTAYRFITLVDILYEARVRLLISGDGTPFELFNKVLSQQEARSLDSRAHESSSGSGPEPVVDDHLAFTKDRTISRLTEMQSIEYQIQHAKQHVPQLVLALKDMQLQQQQQR